MQFKVGDRVEAIKPPNGVADREADQIGLGHIVSINLDRQFGETHAVKLDSGHKWYYSVDRLRHAVEEIEIHPTPSITVGTQVRLTGEVVGYDSLAHPERVEVAIEGARTQSSSYVWVKKSALEVIRQPFKRGEVVYYVGDKDSEPCTVVTDEAEGFVLLARHVHGTETLEWDATSFERRP